MKEYIEFVDKVTSDESKSWESFATRLLVLYEDGFVPQRTLTAAIGFRKKLLGDIFLHMIYYRS